MHFCQVKSFTTLSILVYAPSIFLSRNFVNVQAVDPYRGILSIVALKNPIFRPPESSYFQIVSSLWSADHALPVLMFTSLEQQSIHDPR